MRKVLRGYAKVKDGNLILVGTIPSLIASINRRLENVKTEDIWSGKAQRSLRRNSLIENCRKYARKVICDRSRLRPFFLIALMRRRR